MRQTLKRSEILRGRSNFQLVFRHGRKFEGRYLRCLMLADKRLNLPGSSPSAVGFAVPAALRRAVDRNRLRRLAREAYRLNKEILTPTLENSPSPIALVFLFSSDLTIAARFPSFSEIDQDMKRILHLLIPSTVERR